MRVANKDASEYVNKCEIFEGSNTFSEFKVQYDDKLYVVFSYGYHFPMYMYDYQAKTWIGNEDRFSMSTSKHQSLCRPSEPIECWLNTHEMKEYINCGSMMRYMERKANYQSDTTWYPFVSQFSETN